MNVLELTKDHWKSFENELPEIGRNILIKMTNGDIWLGYVVEKNMMEVYGFALPWDINDKEQRNNPIEWIYVGENNG